MSLFVHTLLKAHEYSSEFVSFKLYFSFNLYSVPSFLALFTKMRAYKVMVKMSFVLLEIITLSFT